MSVPREQQRALLLRVARQAMLDHGLEPDFPPAALVQAGFTQEDAGTVTPLKGVGCDRCNLTGYKGRVGIYQVMPISEEMERIVMKNGTAIDLSDQAQREGVRDLRQSGLLKVKRGLTSLEEIEAVTNE